jgi:hypothetical protein
VVADANGLFGTIYIGVNTYKARLLDKNGVQVWEEDGIKNVFDSLVFNAAEFSSATNSGNFPSAGSRGDVYRVSENFTTGAPSGSQEVFPGDYLICNKDDADAIEADWDVITGAARPVGSPVNLLVNGQMDVWQRAANFPVAGRFPLTVGSSEYTLDMFYCRSEGAALTALDRSTSVPNGDSKYAVQLTGNTGLTSLRFGQPIEALFTAKAQGTVTFSAWIYNGSGAAFTPKLLVETPLNTDSWGGVPNQLAYQDLSPCPAAQWTRVTATLDLTSADLSKGLRFSLEFPAAALDSAAKMVVTAQWQVERGEYASAIEQRDPTLELLRCWRYLFPWGGNSNEVLGVAVARVTDVYLSCRFPVLMRSAPSKIDGWRPLVQDELNVFWEPSSGGAYALDPINFFNSRTQGVSVLMNDNSSTGSLVAGQAVLVTADVPLGQFVALFSAELN